MKGALWVLVILAVALGAFVLLDDSNKDASTGGAIASYNDVCGEQLGRFRAGYEIPDDKSISLVGKCSKTDLNNYARTTTDWKGCDNADFDSNGDGEVENADLIALLENWKKGLADKDDFLALLANWGSVKSC